jgi:hypothetical protein
VPWITALVPHNAVLEKIERLGLSSVLDEVGRILTGFDLDLLEQRNMNGGAAVRRMLDARFEAGAWIREERGTGDIDWIKRITLNGTTVAVGLELQVSGRGGGSHLSDIVHLRAGLSEAEDGRIDVGILVVPTDRLAVFLTDRVEGITQVRRYLKQMRADDLPLLVVAIEHDGPGAALPKQPKKPAGVRYPTTPE